MTISAKFEPFVTTAIKGKYGDFGPDQASRAAQEASKLCAETSSAAALTSLSREIFHPQDDVLNQVVVLTFIDRFRDNSALKTAPMETIHRLAYGLARDRTLRTKSVVEDFPGTIPTSLDQITARFDELQVLVQNLAATPVTNIPTAGHLLAHVFSGAIRIHHFNDGNGRVARFTVQYLLNCWNFGILILPKVRNDADWKSAMEAAVSGDTQQLSFEFIKRLS